MREMKENSMTFERGQRHAMRVIDCVMFSFSWNRSWNLKCLTVELSRLSWWVQVLDCNASQDLGHFDHKRKSQSIPGLSRRHEANQTKFTAKATNQSNHSQQVNKSRVWLKLCNRFVSGWKRAEKEFRAVDFFRVKLIAASPTKSH